MRDPGVRLGVSGGRCVTSVGTRRRSDDHTNINSAKGRRRSPTRREKRETSKMDSIPGVPVFVKSCAKN